MKHYRIFMLPVLVLGQACTLRPWTPSVSVQYSSESMLSWHTTHMPSRNELLTHWMLPTTNAWAPYSKPTLPAFAPEHQDWWNLPNVRELDIVQYAYYTNSMSIGSSMIVKNT